MSGLEILRDFDGLGDGEVSGVGFFAQPVDDEDGNLADEIADRGRHGGAIGQVSGAGLTGKVETEPGGGDTTMGNEQGGEGERADGKGAGDGMRFRANVGRAADFEIEGIIESFFEAGKGEGIGVDGETVTIFDGVGPKVIESSDVVGMAVGVKDSVEFRNGGAKGLRAKIR